MRFFFLAELQNAQSKMSAVVALLQDAELLMPEDTPEDIPEIIQEMGIFF